MSLIVDDQNIIGKHDGMSIYVLNLLQQFDLLKVNGTVHHPFSFQLNKFHHLTLKKHPIPNNMNKHAQKVFFYSYVYYHERVLFRHYQKIIHNLTNFPFPFKISSNRQKYVVTVHDLTTFTHHYFHPLGRSLGYRLGLKRCLQKADGIIAVSDSTKNDLVKILGLPKEKIKVIYLGVNHQQFRPITDECVLQDFRKQFGLNSPYILFVGTIEPRKNVMTLLKAFNLFKKSNDTPHKLVIAGQWGWKVKGVDRMIERFNLKNAVKFTGYFPQRYLHLLYNCADVFVYPSWHEGFGLPVLEAMACGTPVLVTNRSSLPELVAHDESLMFSPSNALQLSKKLEDFITNCHVEDKSLRKWLIKRARFFTWEKTALETLSYYDSLIS